MRISDWRSTCALPISSNCKSTSLKRCGRAFVRACVRACCRRASCENAATLKVPLRSCARAVCRLESCADRKSVVEGKSVSVRVDFGGRRIIKKKNKVLLGYKQYITTQTHKNRS